MLTRLWMWCLDSCKFAISEEKVFDSYCHRVPCKKYPVVSIWDIRSTKKIKRNKTNRSFSVLIQRKLIKTSILQNNDLKLYKKIQILEFSTFRPLLVKFPFKNVLDQIFHFADIKWCAKYYHRVIFFSLVHK